MEIVRYVNNEKVDGDKLPPMEITNPAVILLIQRLINQANSEME